MLRDERFRNPVFLATLCIINQLIVIKANVDKQYLQRCDTPLRDASFEDSLFWKKERFCFIIIH